MARLPPLFALRALEAAARRGSYSRAAEELSVTHSAVSQHIRGLEAELGARLFERRGNRMEPSPPAVLLAHDVARAIDILRKAVTAAAGGADGEALVLSVGGFMARRWLPPRLPRLMADPAGAGLQILVADRHVDFATEPVDCAIRYGSGRWERLDSHRLYGEEMYPVCTPELAQSLGIDRVETVFAAPLLHLHSRPWSIWLETFGHAGPASDGPSFDDSLLMVEAAARGLGVALVAGGMVDEELQSGRLVRPLGAVGVASVDIFLVWPRDTHKLTRIHALRDWLLAEIAAQAGAGAGAEGEPDRSPRAPL